MSSRPVALTIAGTDSSGGAGVAADLKTFEVFGVWGALAVTAVTAQHSGGVEQVAAVDPDMVAAQIAAVAGDLGVDAVKTGMLANAPIVSAVAGALEQAGAGPLVVDPVMVASAGGRLLEPAAVEVIRHRLLPLARVVTPNLDELAVLIGRPVGAERGDVEAAAEALVRLGCRAVVVTGGHRTTDADDLVWDGRPEWIPGRRQVTSTTHGTGCVHSAAITAALASGNGLVEAARRAKVFVDRALRAGVELGAGAGAVDPGWDRRAG